MNVRKVPFWIALAIAASLVIVAALGVVLAYPQPLFAYHMTHGRLELYSDKPFDVSKAQSILVNVDARISSSPLDHRDKTHRIFVANADWRQRIFFNYVYGAGGVNFYPLTRNVFLRNSDIDRDQLIGRSGIPTKYPRTFTYYAAHEITHSLTGEARGMAHLWNWNLPVWIREGYADYVGMGGRGSVNLDTLYSQYRSHDHTFDFNSGYYTRYRMLVAYFLDRRGWTVGKLLDSRMNEEDAERQLNADMSRRSKQGFAVPAKNRAPS